MSGTIWLLDFGQTRLAKGGQLHRVIVGDEGHPSIEAAIADLIRQHRMVGETDTFVPKARVSAQNFNTLGRWVEVQAEPRRLNERVWPTEEEVLAAFPAATHFSTTGHTVPGRSFQLHTHRCTVRREEGGRTRVEVFDEFGELQGQRFGDWMACVRELGELVIEARRGEIKQLETERAALSAAWGVG